ncbi:MAG: hypothetical protein JXA35_09245 [Deltaproteobacteria bacterium]|nr:hypothetical protein [Deltaproteobacteria bacterium]
MKPELKLLATGLLLLLLTVSCGKVVQETVSPVVPMPGSGQYEKAVILPFADYTPAFSPYSYWRRNVLVLEALQDELYKAGIISAVQEDVTKYLLDRGIIQRPRQMSIETTALKGLREEGWSDEMKKEFDAAIYQNMANDAAWKKGLQDQKGIAMDSKMLNDIGNAFDSKYIIRGRIIEFRSSHDDTFDPFRTGILPFIFKTGQRTIFGVAKSDTYETIDKVVIGAALGAVIGHTDSIISPSDSSEYRNWNSLIWGSLGAGAGYLADKGGRVPKATVQLRILVQDAKTGEIVWLNRAEVSTAPFTTYSDPDREALFAQAIGVAVRRLVESFAATLSSGRVVKIDKGGLAVIPKSDTGEGASETSGAAYDARQSARNAEGSAMRAEEAAQRAAAASEEAKESVKRANKASARSEEIFEKTIAK